MRQSGLFRIGRAATRVGAALGLLSLGGCDFTVLEPGGSIGRDERTLIITAFLLMLIVVIPTIAATLIFAWRFRASNTAVEHRPDWAHSNRLETVLWGVPCLIIAALGTITWITTHDLDPYKPLKSTVKPIDIDVVALDWKWLFIYPDQRIASINEVAFPAGTPVNFKITSDTVMNSFFIPQLGSQIYAMAGMQTQDHLIADHTGVFDGLSAQFSGRGFSDMHFRALAETPAQFAAWVAKAKTSTNHLDPAEYAKVVVPSERDPIQFFSDVPPNLFGEVIAKYDGKAPGLQASMKE